MNTIRIQHWHRKYRASSKHAQACESAAAQDVLHAMENELTGRLAPTDEVILIREVNLRFTVDASAYSQSEIADGWGRAMAKAVTEAVDRNDSKTVRRFPNRVEYVLAFLQAHLGGLDTNQWFFDKFKKMLGRSVEPDVNASQLRSLEPLADGLMSGEILGELDGLWYDAIDNWPELGGRLAKLGLLGTALRRTSAPVRERLWLAGVRGFDLRRDHELERPIFAAALLLIHSCSIFEVDSAKASEAYAAFNRHLFVRTDWKDKTHLSEAVYSAFQFLVRHMLESVDVPSVTSGWNAQLESAVAKLDWLDIDWLNQRLKSWFGGSVQEIKSSSTSGAEQAEPAAQWVPRQHPVGSANPSHRQSAWTAAWNNVSSKFYAQWDASEPCSTHNRLLAFGLLTEVCPAWGGEPALAVFVEKLLDGSSHSFLETDFDREDERAFALRSNHKSNLRIANQPAPYKLGNTTSDLETKTRIRRPSASQGWSEFAGIFLLLRSISDLRLPSLAKSCQFPNESDSAAACLLVELALNWQISQSFNAQLNDEDCGLKTFVNLVSPATWGELCNRPLSANQTATESFQRRLAETLVRQGAWAQPTQLQICTHPTPNGKFCLLGGDGTTRVFPFSIITTNTMEATSTIEQWTSWLAALGGEAIEVQLDPTTLAVFGDLGWPVQHAAKCDSRLRWAQFASLDERFQCTCAATADVVLRHWSRWLKGNKNASNEYLLDQFVRRGGYIHASDNRIVVVLERKPLDVVLQVSGALEPFDYFANKRMVKVVFQTSDVGSTS